LYVTEGGGNRKTEKLRSEDFHNLHASRVIKSKTMSWAERVACMGRIKNIYKILVGERGGRNIFEDLGADGRIILEWILKI
jgi:hypothetical protein